MAKSFNRLVQSDLRIVLQYYETVGGKKLADRFFDEVTAVVLAIEQRPGSFHPVAEGLRRANMPTFPYHFLFRERVGSVRVLVLRHHRRHPTFGRKRE
jgi:plasmid stabilization system protein ParE